jgi:hypothetical protein
VSRDTPSVLRSRYSQAVDLSSERSFFIVPAVVKITDAHELSTVVPRAAAAKSPPVAGSGARWLAQYEMVGAQSRVFQRKHAVT